MANCYYILHVQERCKIVFEMKDFTLFSSVQATPIDSMNESCPEKVCY